MLDVCSSIFVSGSDSLKHWRATHNLVDGCLPILVSGSDPQTLKRNSQTG